MALTKAEFEKKWGPRPERVAVPAERDGPCDYKDCEGWHWVNPEWWETDVKWGMRDEKDLELVRE